MSKQSKDDERRPFVLRAALGAVKVAVASVVAVPTMVCAARGFSAFVEDYRNNQRSILPPNGVPTNSHP